MIHIIDKLYWIEDIYGEYHLLKIDQIQSITLEDNERHLGNE